MRTAGWLTAVATTGALAVFASQSFSQDTPKKPEAPKSPSGAPSAPKAPEMKHDMKEAMKGAAPDANMQAMMEACAKAATPGPMHDHLKKSVGEWDGKTTMWMMPGTPPMESTCTAKVTELMDGRFIKIDVNGDMPGMGPFHGLGTIGFDNVSKKFQYNWIDNMGTGMMTGTGTLEGDNKTMNWSLVMNDPMTGKETKCREVDVFNGNTMTMEMFAPGPDGKEAKMMHIDYTRKGAAKESPKNPSKDQGK